MKTRKEDFVEKIKAIKININSTFSSTLWSNI